jgi:single-stranded-DNA-specific exonuclease
LAWLVQRLLKTCPQVQIVVADQVVPLPRPGDLLAQVQQYLHTETTLDLLRVAQTWWVAPSTVVAALRHLGHPCPDFPATASLTQELEKLERWYQTPLETLPRMI